MSGAELLSSMREDVLRSARRHGAESVRVFGSTARGEDGQGSDIDLLVRMTPGRSLLDIAAMKVELEDLLGRSVDIVTEDSLYWLLRRRILREARAI